MIKHFTTPEFADLLKQHGIEIDTPFLFFENDLFIKRSDNRVVSVMFGYEDFIGEDDYQPAYLLSEVLTWLPFSITYQKQSATLVSIVDHDGVRVNYRIGEYAIYNKHLPIEQLITQGLTEGWLTKEIIEQSIKQNQ